VWVSCKECIQCPVTKYKCVTECIPVTCKVKVCKPVTRTVCEKVCTYKCVPETKCETYTCWTCKCVPYTATRCKTVCVPYCEQVTCCRMVARCVAKQVCDNVCHDVCHDAGHDDCCETTKCRKRFSFGRLFNRGGNGDCCGGYVNGGDCCH
jgi:hypothetical protein